MLSALLETFGVLVLVALAVLAGLRCSRLKKPWWLIGYVVPLVLVYMIALVRHKPWLGFVTGFSLVTSGRNEYVIMSLALPMVLSTLIPRFDKLRIKILVGILLAVGCLHFSILPFFMPGLFAGKLAALETNMDDGVCLQSTDYTCGAASAVTALKQLGIDAEESLLAVRSHTTSVYGADEDMLAIAIEKLYGDAGVQCQCRYYDSVDMLKDSCPVIAIVKYAPLVDHYVTIMEVDDNYVMIGDPLEGKVRLTHEDFKKKWRFVGIEIKRVNGLANIRSSLN